MKLVFVLYFSLCGFLVQGQTKNNSKNQENLCKEDSVMFIFGTWKKLNDANIQPVKNLDLIRKRVSAIGKLLQEAYPVPAGTTAIWYLNMFPYPIVEGGPAAYSYNAHFNYLYCNKNMNRLIMSDETAIGCEVHINNLEGWVKGQNNVLKIKVDDDEIFLLPNVSGNWKGYPLYQWKSSGRASQNIIITRDGELPWKPVTRKQYLIALKTEWLSKTTSIIDYFDKSILNLKEGIRYYQEMKEIKPEEKDDMIKGLKKNLDELQSNKQSEVEKTKRKWDEKIALIDEYLKNNENDLNRPVFIDYNDMTPGDFEGRFSRENSGHALVRYNPEYFKKKLANDIPQVIVLSWSWNLNVPGLYFARQVEEKFPVEKLRAMIDN